MEGGLRDLQQRFAGAAVNLENAETCKLTYRLENPTEQDQTYAVLPLLTPTWTPQDAPSQVALKPGKKTLVNITYKRTAPANTQGRSDLFPPHEAVFRLPVLTVGGGMARIEEARGGITPVAVLWNTGAAFNRGWAGQSRSVPSYYYNQPGLTGALRRNSGTLVPGPNFQTMQRRARSTRPVDYYRYR